MSNNSFNVETLKYLCLTVLMCYSDNTRGARITVNGQSQWGDCGWSFWLRRYEWVKRVWPIRSLVRTTASWRLRLLRLLWQRRGLTERNLFETDLSHSTCQRRWQWLDTSAYRPVAGHFTTDIFKLRADLAALLACSLPLIPIWLGIQTRMIVLPELELEQVCENCDDGTVPRLKKLSESSTAQSSSCDAIQEPQAAVCDFLFSNYNCQTISVIYYC